MKAQAHTRISPARISQAADMACTDAAARHARAQPHSHTRRRRRAGGCAVLRSDSVGASTGAGASGPVRRRTRETFDDEGSIDPHVPRSALWSTQDRGLAQRWAEAFPAARFGVAALRSVGSGTDSYWVRDRMARRGLRSCSGSIWKAYGVRVACLACAVGQLSEVGPRVHRSDSPRTWSH